MGTDIHIAVEQRDDAGVWEPAFDELFTDYVEGDDRSWVNTWGAPTQRDYSLFSVLSGLRAHGQFLHPVTREVIPPVLANRTWPSDADVVEDYDLGDHTYTHATLRELVALPWDAIRLDPFVMREPPYLEWQKAGLSSPPPYYYDFYDFDFGSRNRALEVTVTEEEYLKGQPDALLNFVSRIALPDDNLLISGTRETRPVQDCAFRKWVDWMAAKCPDHDRVRVLIGYDS